MYKAQINNQTFEVTIHKDEVRVDDNILNWDVEKIDERNFHIIHNNKCYRTEVVSVDVLSRKVILKINGKLVEVELKDKLSLMLEKLGIDITASSKINEENAPMP